MNYEEMRYHVKSNLIVKYIKMGYDNADAILHAEREIKNYEITNQQKHN